MSEAAVLVKAAVAKFPADPVLAALGGAVEYHRGKHVDAIPYLEVAHGAHPQDVVVRTNLAESYFHCDRGGEALALCEGAVLEAPSGLRLARLGAHLAQQAGEFSRAAALYRVVLKADPQDWSVLNNLGNALLDEGEAAEAIDVLEKALSLAPDAGPIRVNLGNALLEAGRFEEGEELLKETAQASPADVAPVMALTTYYRAAGLEDQMYEALAEAARRAPREAGILSDYGQEAARRNDYEIAEQSYEAALAIEPALGPSFVGLGALYERTNREDELESLRERAVRHSVDGQTISYIDALRFKRGENFEDALASLDASGEMVTASRRHHLRGIMLDRLGRYDEAFSEFRQMNDVHRDEPSQPEERAKLYRDAVERDAKLLSGDWVSKWAPAPPTDRKSPVVLLGFPRSGTTLLDTMLMTVKDTLVLEEEHFFNEIEQHLGGIEALPSLSADAIVEARARYFEMVSAKGEIGTRTTIVDKHPLHINKVPIIRRLFPDAKFVLALRHPCDVLLSCYITNFRTNHAMSNFLDLQTAAQLYDMSFAYWTKARELFNLPVHTVVYERLVADQSRELAPLFDWLGLPWQGDDFDHREAARARGVVRTASYAQVTEPIYTRASGRWHRYEKHLEPVFTLLRPWAERFGYSLDDDRVPGWGECSGASAWTA